MRADWPLELRAVCASALIVLTACTTTLPGPAPAMEPPLQLTEENFHGRLGAETVHPNEAAARVAMAECAAIGTLSASAQGQSADAVVTDVVTQLQLALRRSGANAYALQTQHWERVAGAMRLEITLQALICSA